MFSVRQHSSFVIQDTVSSKIIRALEIIDIKKLIPIQFYEINICQVMIFRLYTVYNKHDMIKIDNETRKKAQVYRKCSNKFAADCKTNEI